MIEDRVTMSGAEIHPKLPANEAPKLQVIAITHSLSTGAVPMGVSRAMQATSVESAEATQTSAMPPPNSAAAPALECTHLEVPQGKLIAAVGQHATGKPPLRRLLSEDLLPAGRLLVPQRLPPSGLCWAAGQQVRVPRRWS